MCDSSSEEDVAEFGDCDEQDAAVQRPVKKKRVQVLKQCSEDGCNNKAWKQGRCGTCHAKATGEKRVLKQCSEEGCNNNAYKQGRCFSCQAKATGEKRKQCSEEGCDKEARKQGRCGTCYAKATGEKPKQCSEDGCDNQAKKQGRCLTCHAKATGEKQVRKQCSEDGCDNKANKQGRCETCHTKATGEERRRTFCPGDGKTECPYRVQLHPTKNRYDNNCPRCFVSKHANSTDPTLRERVKHVGSCFRAREMAVRDFLERALPEYRWVFDRRITGHLTRPDAKTVVSDRVIVVEIDEDSHQRRQSSRPGG